MKTLFIIVAVVGLMSGCGSNTKNSQEQVPAGSTEAVDMHNPKNSLDYKGTYTGKIPTAGGEGMLVTIELGDNTFVRTIEYVGKKEAPFVEKGSYTWNADGNTVILDADKDSPNQYFVENGILTQLDMSGNKIAGELADMYILKKK
ncbi:MAG: copper resistance protein NlpE [Prevotella sp.]|jgi:uncharacterized lipoprotein NlpE involved in copper resistance|nr:copper resistance protein NlpE [Prevotella sp.]